MKFRPRNENVLVRVVDKGQTPGGLAIPQISVEGKHYIVEAIGPKVEDLEVGDRVLMLGQLHQDYDYVPNYKDLLLINQKNVVLVYEGVEG